MPRVFIIAEAGVNHDGDLDRAVALVDAAAASGADAVKFQSFTAAASISRFAPKAEYQLAQTSADESQLEMVRRLELDEEAHRHLHRRASEKGIRFLSTAFDSDALDLLVALDVNPLKVASGEITNLPMLRRIGALGRDIILSTGMAEMAEIEAALDVLEQAGASRDAIIVLHCNTEYPTPLADVNLRAMTTIGERLGVRVGLSDHSLGITVAIAAAALGACVIEKHITLDRTAPGPDHAASLEPDQFAAMVRGIREVEQALGSSKKTPSPSERKNIGIARKSIVAARPIPAGTTISADMIAAKRPGTGVSPMRWDDVIGAVAPRDYATDEPLDLVIPPQEQS